MRPGPDDPPVAGRLPRRRTDRVEDVTAWILATAALLLVLAAGVTGLGTYGREVERGELHRASATQVRAVVLEDAEVLVSEVGERMPVPVLARWTDRDGREHTGPVVVYGVERAGSEVDVWIDAAGEVTSRPGHPANAVVGGIVSAFGVLCAGGMVLIAARWVVRRLTGVANARQWDREWAAVEPQWRRNVL
jgi:hypothetical protein